MLNSDGYNPARRQALNDRNPRPLARFNLGSRPAYPPKRGDDILDSIVGELTVISECSVAPSPLHSSQAEVVDAQG
jgi:hypothetical protein